MRIKIIDVLEQEIEIDLDRRDKTVWKKGAMVFKIAPWGAIGCPLTLEFAVCPDGEILHRGWSWRGEGDSGYIHYHADVCGNSEADITEAMKETIAGLFSGRIKIDGVRIPVGATTQKAIGGIDIEAEEKRLGKTIYLA